jgi:charged multivesicular body protein 3
MKVAGVLQKSGEIMKITNQLIKLPELSMTMQNMQAEMMKAGLIDEMMADTMDMMDGDDIEEEADAEIDAVVYEITKGMLGTAGPTANNALNLPQEEEEEEKDDFAERLQALRN